MRRLRETLIADGSPGRHRRRTSEASSAATEHANDDNTGPRGSDATERAATIEVMTTPAVAMARSHMAGACTVAMAAAWALTQPPCI